MPIAECGRLRAIFGLIQGFLEVWKKSVTWLLGLILFNPFSFLLLKEATKLSFLPPYLSSFSLSTFFTIPKRWLEAWSLLS